MVSASVPWAALPSSVEEIAPRSWAQKRSSDWVTFGLRACLDVAAAGHGKLGLAGRPDALASLSRRMWGQDGLRDPRGGREVSCLKRADREC